MSLVYKRKNNVGGNMDDKSEQKEGAGSNVQSGKRREVGGGCNKG